MATKKVPFAIAYDFDGTLAPGNMQERDFIPAIGANTGDFWDEVKKLARKHEGDQILAYMGLMIKKANASNVAIRRQDFRDYGRKLRLFPGLVNYQDKDGTKHKGWFDRINTYAEEAGIVVDHFVISSGVRDMIEGSSIGGVFKKIYASGFQFDANDVAVWPALSVNFTTKTQFLFRINKGSLDVFDDSVINRYVPDEERAVPFRNIVFIGDGDTDIPCFRLVKELRGHSIAVYPDKTGAKAKPKLLMEEGRINYFALADYREGRSLDRIVKAIIDKVQIDTYLVSFS